MSGETERQPSGWTIDTALEHMRSLLVEKDLRDEQRFRAQQAAVQAELAGLARAVDKAEVATEKRFEGVNEFRSQLADQARDFMPRREAEQAIEAVRSLISVEHERGNALDRKQGEIAAGHVGGDKVLAYVLAAVGVLIGIAGIVARFA